MCMINHDNIKKKKNMPQFCGECIHLQVSDQVSEFGLKINQCTKGTVKQAHQMAEKLNQI